MNFTRWHLTFKISSNYNRAQKKVAQGVDLVADTPHILWDRRSEHVKSADHDRRSEINGELGAS